MNDLWGLPEDYDHMDADYLSASNAEYQQIPLPPFCQPIDPVKLSRATPDDWLDTYLWIQKIPLKEIKSC